MKKTEIIKKVKRIIGAKSISGIAVILEHIIATIKEGLLKDNIVKIEGLGTFQVKEIPERTGVNPRTKEKIKIPGYKKVKFYPSITIKKSLNEK